jgi:hypothetical protein
VADPFLDIDEFTAEYQGTLSEGELVTADRLLQVISDGIRSLKADVDETAARQVVFEVVRDEMTYGHLGPLSSFANITSRREEKGTFERNGSLVDNYLTARHCRILGLPIANTAAPRGSFVKGDY